MRKHERRLREIMLRFRLLNRERVRNLDEIKSRFFSEWSCLDLSYPLRCEEVYWHYRNVLDGVFRSLYEDRRIGRAI